MPSSGPSPQVTVIPLYVAAAALPAPRVIRPPTPPYGFSVNDETFYEDTCDEDQDNNYIKFEVYARSDSSCNKMESRYDLCRATTSDSEPESDCEEDAYLQITQQKVPGGCIINCNVYLTELQWNTFVNVDSTLIKCGVCDMFSDIDTMHQHASGRAHEMNIQKYLPLHKFDMSITRKIEKSYHCAVCNQIFYHTKLEDHFGTKTHEGNLLFAINKATDILYNSRNSNDIDTDRDERSIMYSNNNTGDASNKDCYYFNINNIRDNESVNSDHCHGDNNDYYDGDNNDYINFQNEFHNDMMTDYYEEPELPITGISYAKMAKKPKIEMQQFIDVELYNKKVKVCFDSWHMIICPKANRFYCMVCKKLDHIRHKSEHCSQQEHFINLEKCSVVEAYGEYFIRQVDDKLYHCGHCNNLQLIHEMEDHVEMNHPRRTRLTSETKHAAQTSVKTDSIVKSDSDKCARNSSSPATPVKSAVAAAAYKALNLGSPVKSDKFSVSNDNHHKALSFGSPVNSIKYLDNSDKHKALNFGSSVKTDKFSVNSDNHKALTNPVLSDKISVNSDNHLKALNFGSTVNNEKYLDNSVKHKAVSFGSPVKTETYSVNSDNYGRNSTHAYAIPNAAARQNFPPSARAVDTNDNQIVTYVKSNNNQSRNIFNVNNNTNFINRENSMKNVDTSCNFQDIEIYPFGCKMLLPFLSYNAVLWRNERFYCVLCDLICPSEAIRSHVREVHHLELLQRTPFIDHFKFNLIRAIRDAFHCAICNNLTKADKILFHSNDPIHGGLLIKCLKYKPMELEDQKDVITSDNKIQGANNIEETTPIMPKTAQIVYEVSSQIADAKNLANNTFNNNQIEKNVDSFTHRVNMAKGANNMVQEANIAQNRAQTGDNFAQNRLRLTQLYNENMQRMTQAEPLRFEIPNVTKTNPPENKTPFTLNTNQIEKNVDNFAHRVNMAKGANNMAQEANIAQNRANNIAQTGDNFAQNRLRLTQMSNENMQRMTQAEPLRFEIPNVTKTNPPENKTPFSFAPNMPKVFSLKHKATSMNNFDNTPLETNNELIKANNTPTPRAVTKMAYATANVHARPVLKTSGTQDMQGVNKEVSQLLKNTSVIPKVASLAANIANVASFVGQQMAKFAPSVSKIKTGLTINADTPSGDDSNADSMSNAVASNTNIKDKDSMAFIPEMIEDRPFVMPDLSKPPPNIVTFINRNGNLAPVLPHTEPPKSQSSNAAQTQQNDIESTQAAEELENGGKASEDDKEFALEEEELVEEDEMDETFESMGSEDAMFDLEEYVYLKLKNVYIKISNTSYNTLVVVGDGSRYCFACSERVELSYLQKHVDSRAHLQSLEGYRFLDKYEDHLLRQNFLMYHCAICNVIVNRKELRTHLDWPEHILQNDNTSKNMKKQRKNEIKGGVKDIIVSTQKENIYLNENEPPVNIFVNARIVNKQKSDANNAGSVKGCSLVKKVDEKCESVKKGVILKNPLKKNKIIMFNDVVLKVSWESWHSVCQIRSGIKCNLCQKELRESEVETHCDGEWHKYSLEKPVERQYLPAIIRKVDESTLNCVICNTELSNKSNLVTEHVKGKKHIKNYDQIVAESTTEDTQYDDCDHEVLTIN